MKRRLFTAAAFMSLLLCVASAVMRFARVHGGYTLVNGDGDIAGPGTRATVALLTADGGFGISWTYTDFLSKEDTRSVPFPVSLAIFSILPCVWIARRLRARPVNPLQCPTCSYDLTGNTSGVCPECGTPVMEQKLSGMN